MTAQAEPTPSNTGTVSFGLGQLTNATPIFAKWIFRGYFIISKAIVGWMGYTKLIPQADLYEILGVVSLLLDPIVLGISNLFGVKADETK